jgi:hypothetical protein
MPVRYHYAWANTDSSRFNKILSLHGDFERSAAAAAAAIKI